jgi:sporulation protein YlmC with PRC-barrel domain
MNLTKLLSSVAVASLLAMPAFAQTSSSPATSPSTSRPATTAPSGAATNRATMPSDIAQMKVSDLVGKSVYSSSDERIGEVDDVVVAKSGGEAMAVIGVGGFLGIGEKDAAVPVSQLKVQGDKIVATGATKDSLKQHAEYKKDNYTKVDRDKMVSQVGTGTTGSTTRPSTSGSSATSPATGSSTTPSGTSSSGAAGSSGTSGSSTMGGASSSPSTSGSSTGSSGMSGSTSGTTGSGGSSSGSMGSGSSSGSPSTGSANPGATSNPPSNAAPTTKQ